MGLTPSLNMLEEADSTFSSFCCPEKMAVCSFIAGVWGCCVVAGADCVACVLGTVVTVVSGPPISPASWLCSPLSTAPVVTDHPWVH